MWPVLREKMNGIATFIGDDQPIFIPVCETLAGDAVRAIANLVRP